MDSSPAQRVDAADEATGSPRVVMLVATEAEARPILEALAVAEQLVVATKKVYLGRLAPRTPAPIAREGVAVALAIGGCDKTNTAHMLTHLLTCLCPAPALVVQAGIAGAFSPQGEGSDADSARTGPGVGDVVIATQEAYSDTGSSSAAGWLSAEELGLPIACVNGIETGGVFALDQGLAERARRAILAYDWPEPRPAVFMGPCVTSSRVTGTRSEAEAVAEALEPARRIDGGRGRRPCVFTVRDAVCGDQGDKQLGRRPRQGELAGGEGHRRGRPGSAHRGGGLGRRGRGPVMPAKREAGSESAQRPLVLAYSPCPNDTFIFHAWVHGLVAGAPAVQERLEDIDTLNRLALEGQADVIKVSMCAFARLRDRYALLHSGGAMGRGCGPLIVAPKGSRMSAAPNVRRVTALADELQRARVAVPGELTTAALLAHLFTGGLERPVVMPFDQIMAAVAEGEVDAGVIIHEGRFTYGSYGLRRLVDLGEWWEDFTGLPLPLGGIAVRRALDKGQKADIEKAVRASVEQGRAEPAATAEYVLAHAQEMDPLVCQQHIDLYVNDFSVGYGAEGDEAIRRLLEAAAGLPAASGVGGAAQAPVTSGLFWDD